MNWMNLGATVGLGGLCLGLVQYGAREEAEGSRGEVKIDVSTETTRSLGLQPGQPPGGAGAPSNPSPPSCVGFAGQAQCTGDSQCLTTVPVCADTVRYAPRCVDGLCVYTSIPIDTMCPCMEHDFAACALPDGGAGQKVCARKTSATTQWCGCN